VEGRDSAEALSRANVADGSALATLLQVVFDRLLVIHSQARVHTRHARVECKVRLQSVPRSSLHASTAQVRKVHARALLRRHPCTRVRTNLILHVQLDGIRATTSAYFIEFMLKSGVLTANVLLLAGESKSLVHLARLDTHHVRRRQIRHQLLVRCVRQFKRVRRPSVHLIGHLGSVVQRSTVLIDPGVCCELIGRDGGLTMIAQALHEGARLHFSHLSAL